MEVTNRFKRVDLIDRVPEELWTEVCDIIHVSTAVQSSKPRDTRITSKVGLVVQMKLGKG